jgi:mannose-6-phosphate isomerase-like protein (cupin superfamily)
MLIMAGYQLENLKDVEDSAPKFGLAPKLEARFARAALGLERSGLSYQRLAPNFRIPFGHKHEQQEEVYIVVSGGGRMKLDDEIVELRQWDAVRVAAETTRNFEAGPEGAELIVFGAPATPPGDGEMTPGWWGD